MGSALSDLYDVDDTYSYHMTAVNLPDSIRAAAEAEGLTFPLWRKGIWIPPSRNWNGRNWTCAPYSRRGLTRR